MVELRLLGVVELWAAGRRVSAGPQKQRSVLAVLGMSAGTMVPADVLIDRVWGETPPRDVRSVLYTHIARLRTLLGAQLPAGSPPVLPRGSGGYVLQLARDQVDVHRFHGLVERARDTSGEDRWRLLREALELWRGTPLAGVRGQWANSVRDRLEQLRIATLVDRIDLDLRLEPDNSRQRSNLVEELAALLIEYPAAERFAGQLMLALYREGRTSDALATYQRIRRHLEREFGSDPSPQLQLLHQRLLLQDPALVLLPGREKDAAPEIPRQLPIAPGTFVGRAAEQDRIVTILTSGDAASPPIVAICGPGGAGKSALALHVAHRVSHHFPDGQLYVDLQGHTPGMSPLSPLQALSRFLRALGMAGSAIPAGPAEAAARFRSILAGRRVLLVLDNAADIHQVRALLPATAGCGVLVTSRSVLSALDDATRIRLSVLHPDESHRLLALLDPTGRLSADVTAGERLAELCGHLPLALRIAAARMTSRPDWPLAAFVERLVGEQHRLDHLGHEDVSVRACFRTSYESLVQGGAEDREAARAFRLLGLPDGPDVSLPIAALLLDRPLPTAEKTLDRLVDAQLLETPVPGRYRMHDLLHLYAREIAAAQTSGTDRYAALNRAWRCYTATAAAAGNLLRPGFRSDVLRTDMGPALPLTGWDDANAWFGAESANLSAASRQAANAPGELSAITIHLAHLLFIYMQRNTLWAELLELNRLALEVARHRQDRYAKGQILSDLGVLAWQTGNGDEAVSLFEESLLIHRETGNRTGEARSLHNLSAAYGERGQYDAALEYGTGALPLFQEVGHQSGEAMVHDALAHFHWQSGNHDAAVDHHRASIALHRELDDKIGEALTLRHLGMGLVDRQQPADAIRYLEQSLAISREHGDLTGLVWSLLHLSEAHRLIGNPEGGSKHCTEALSLSRRLGVQQERAIALWRMGTILATLGDPALAREHWREALPIFERLGAPEAGEVRRLLATVSDVTCVKPEAP